MVGFGPSLSGLKISLTKFHIACDRSARWTFGASPKLVAEVAVDLPPLVVDGDSVQFHRVAVAEGELDHAFAVNLDHPPVGGRAGVGWASLQFLQDQSDQPLCSTVTG